GRSYYPWQAATRHSRCCISNAKNATMLVSHLLQKVPLAGAGGKIYMDRWLLFRCKNSQERSRTTVCRASETKAWMRGSSPRKTSSWMPASSQPVILARKNIPDSPERKRESICISGAWIPRNDDFRDSYKIPGICRWRGASLRRLGQYP